MKYRRYLTITLLIVFVVAAHALGKPSATDPTERGLSYIAAAIVASAVIRVLYDKR